MSDQATIVTSLPSAKKTGSRLIWQLLVPLVCVLIFARVVDLDRWINILINADSSLMSLALLVYGLTAFFFLWRWRRILQKLAIHYSLLRLLPVFSTGYAFQYFLPSGLGDFVKLLYIVEDGYSTEKATVSVVVDKLASYVSALLLGGLGLLVLPVGELARSSSAEFTFLAQPAGWLGGAAVLGGAMSVIYRRRQPIMRWLQAKLNRWQSYGPLARILKLGQNSVQELASFKVGHYAEYVTLSILAGAVEGFVYYLIARAIGIDMPFVQVWAISSLLTLLLSIPVISVTVGGLGVRDSLLAGLFLLLGRSVEEALAFSLLIFVITAAWRVIALTGWLARPVNVRRLVGRIQG